MHKQIFIIALIACICSTPIYAQRELKEMDTDKQAQKEKDKYESSEPWYEKMSYGGNITGGFGNGASFFLIQPQAYYKVLPKTMVGAGVTYIYWSQKYINLNGTTSAFSDNAFGLNILARQVLFGPVFAHAEYMPLNFTSYNRLGEEKRIWGNSLYLGGGYSNAGNQKSGAYILVLYDVLWHQDDLLDPKTFSRNFYASPWNFRIGFLF